MRRAGLIAELSRFISATMSPLLMPFYGVFIASWISPICLQSPGIRMKLVLITLGITCITPIMFIAILQNLNVIKNKRLEDRHERLLPYVFAIICYLSLVAYFSYIHEPMWLIMFAAGGTLALVITTIVNRFWKISAHATGSAGIMAMIYQIKAMDLEVIDPRWMLGIILFSILCCGCVCSSRLFLRKHTLSQVFAGVANGFISVSLLMRLFG